MNPTDDTSLQPMEFVNFSIRDYVAEVRQKDWKKCYPFNLSGDSSESNYQEKMVFASLLLEGVDSLGVTPENTEAPNRVIVSNDATHTINGRPLELDSSKATYAYCQVEKIINGETMASENNTLKDVVIDYESINNTNDGASKSPFCKFKDDFQFQIKNNIFEDIISAGNENHTVFDDDRATTISDEERNLEGRKPQKFRLLSDILKELAGPCNVASSSFDDIELTSESEDDDDYTPDTLVRKKKGVQITSKSGSKSKNNKKTYKVLEPSFSRTKRMRALSQISFVKDLEIVSKCHVRKTRTTREDIQMMNKRKRYSVECIVHETKIAPTSLSGVENTYATQKDSLIEPSFDRGKRMKAMNELYGGKDTELSSKRYLRKNRTPRAYMHMMNKHKKSSTEIIMHENIVAPTSLRGRENTSGTQKDSLISCEYIESEETIQEDSVRDVLKLLDGSQRRFKKENNSRANGIKIAQVVQPTIAILNNKDTTYDYVEEGIWESSPLIDNESMAALQLLRLFNSGVNTKESSKTSTKDPLSSMSKGKISRGLDEIV